jgi:hypothetical protein
MQWNFPIYADHWEEVDSIQLVEDTKPANGGAWFQDGNTLYFSENRDFGDTYGFSYYVPTDKWNGRGCTGDGDVDKSDPETGDWPDNTDSGWNAVGLDVTDWVKTWFSNPAANYGLMITSGGKEGGWRTSEYNAGTVENPDYTLGPKLVIDYNPVPEPGTVTLSLLSLFGIWVLARRRGTC